MTTSSDYMNGSWAFSSLVRWQVYTTDQTETLSKLLVDHGVPKNIVAERAQQVIAKLGAQGVIEALTARNSWSYLKALAKQAQLETRPCGWTFETCCCHSQTKNSGPRSQMASRRRTLTRKDPLNLWPWTQRNWYSSGLASQTQKMMRPSRLNSTK